MRKDKEETTEDDEEIRCICDNNESIGVMIQCEECGVWQHCDCMNIIDDPVNYWCEECRPQDHPYYSKRSSIAQVVDNGKLVKKRNTLNSRTAEIFYDFDTIDFKSLDNIESKDLFKELQETQDLLNDTQKVKDSLKETQEMISLATQGIPQESAKKSKREKQTLPKKNKRRKNEFLKKLNNMLEFFDEDIPINDERWEDSGDLSLEGDLEILKSKVFSAIIRFKDELNI